MFVTLFDCPCVIDPDAASQLDQLIVELEQLLGARVVTLQLSVTPPTLTVAESAVENDSLDVSCTRKVWPFVIVPDVTQPPPLMLIFGLPEPLTDKLAPVVRPDIVIVFDVMSVLSACPVTSVKAKASGALSVPVQGPPL